MPLAVIEMIYIFDSLFVFNCNTGRFAGDTSAEHFIKIQLEYPRARAKANMRVSANKFHNLFPSAVRFDVHVFTCPRSFSASVYIIYTVVPLGNFSLRFAVYEYLLYFSASYTTQALDF